MLTSELDPGLLADDCAIDVPGHTDVSPTVLFVSRVGDNQVSPHQAVVLVWLLHQFDLPVITAPPAYDIAPLDINYLCCSSCEFV